MLKKGGQKGKGRKSRTFWGFGAATKKATAKGDGGGIVFQAREGSRLSRSVTAIHCANTQSIGGFKRHYRALRQTLRKRRKRDGTRIGQIARAFFGRRDLAGVEKLGDEGVRMGGGIKSVEEIAGTAGRGGSRGKTKSGFPGKIRTAKTFPKANRGGGRRIGDSIKRNVIEVGAKLQVKGDHVEKKG